MKHLLHSTNQLKHQTLNAFMAARGVDSVFFQVPTVESLIAEPSIQFIGSSQSK